MKLKRAPAKGGIRELREVDYTTLVQMASNVLRTIRCYSSRAPRLIAGTVRTAMPTLGAWANQSTRGPSLTSTATTPSCRTFISSFPIPSVISGELEKTLDMYNVVPYTPELMYKVVSEVDKYEQFLPFCCKSEVLR